MIKQRIGQVIAFALICAVAATVIVMQTPAGRAAYHVADFRIRRWQIQQWGRPAIPPEQRGGLAGRVVGPDGQPLSGAVVLVAEATGETHYDYTDLDGRYEITGAPAGRYVPLAAAWGYRPQARPAIRVRPGAILEPIDFSLEPRRPFSAPTTIPVTITERTVVTGTFPSPDVQAERIGFRFFRAGVEVAVDQVFQPVGQRSPGPTLVMAFPSHEPHWDPPAIAFASQGFTVLSVKPVMAHGWLDIQAHAEDLQAAVTLLTSGALTPAADPQRMAWLAGSFSTLFMYLVLPDHPEVRAVITVGGISDAFLGVEALYEESLEIPERFRLAVASLGRPDRDPAFFMQYSPAFFAAHMPPTLVVHTPVDRVIPYNQSVRFAQALANAGIPHELILYQDTTHYLNAANPSPEGIAVFWRMIEFLTQTLSPISSPRDEAQTAP
ncbi:MAG: carboxypeptidase regulatory-like domain-containing protein [Anaerolineae bacterium]|nr:carboxypeptidase regulatory-like domain-containing protein [Anaerolineae bacterium]MDW8100448.1 carboxypeptidase regulatory-like domain-containing protein [Anaerolineae bacterium]